MSSQAKKLNQHSAAAEGTNKNEDEKEKRL
jgi:hypothetical protein